MLCGITVNLHEIYILVSVLANLCIYNYKVMQKKGMKSLTVVRQIFERVIWLTKKNAGLGIIIYLFIYF